MKKNQGRKLPFFYHWKLSRKLLLLFLGVCVLPITVILGITMYRMVCSSIQMQLYTMDQNMIVSYRILKIFRSGWNESHHLLWYQTKWEMPCAVISRTVW